MPACLSLSLFPPPQPSGTGEAGAASTTRGSPSPGDSETDSRPPRLRSLLPARARVAPSPPAQERREGSRLRMGHLLLLSPCCPPEREDSSPLVAVGVSSVVPSVSPEGGQRLRFKPSSRVVDEGWLVEPSQVLTDGLERLGRACKCGIPLCDSHSW